MSAFWRRKSTSIVAQKKGTSAFDIFGANVNPEGWDEIKGVSVLHSGLSGYALEQLWTALLPTAGAGGQVQFLLH